MPGLLTAVIVATTALVPLAGVIWFDWDGRDILALYWLECVVVGAFTAIKMWFADGRPSETRHLPVTVAFSNFPKPSPSFFSCFTLAFF